MVKVFCVERNPFQALALLINIHHGINLARDAIQYVNESGKGCGLLDLDLVWTYCKVLKSISRTSRIYAKSLAVVHWWLTRSLAAH